MDNLKYVGGTPWSKEHDPDRNLERMDAAISAGLAHKASSGVAHSVVAELDGYMKVFDYSLGQVMLPDDNVEALATGIARANSLLAVMNTHAADGVEHFAVSAHTHSEPATVDGTAGGIITVGNITEFLVNDEIAVVDNDTGPVAGFIIGITETIPGVAWELHIQDALVGGADVDLTNYTVGQNARVDIAGRPSPDVVNFPIATPVATDLPSLLTLTGDLLLAYEAHNLDAQAATPDFHNSIHAGFDLVTSAAPTDLYEAFERLNDLWAMYNSHEGNATSHTTGGLHTDVSAAVAFGVEQLLAIPGMLGTEVAWVQFLAAGAGGATAVAIVTPGVDELSVTFDATPIDIMAGAPGAVVRFIVFAP